MRARPPPRAAERVAPTPWRWSAALELGKGPGGWQPAREVVQPQQQPREWEVGIGQAGVFPTAGPACARC